MNLSKRDIMRRGMKNPATLALLFGAAGWLMFAGSRPAVQSPAPLPPLQEGLRAAGRDSSSSAKGAGPAAFELKTRAFKPGGEIPKKYTCDGPEVSPPLTWGDPAGKIQSFALIADDPDAPMGTWVHWVAYDLPATTRQLPEGISPEGEIAGGGRQGTNDFGKLGYGGPCPPPGKPHRYFFKLYGLDTKLGLKVGATKSEVEKVMEGHILARAELLGRYHR